MAKRNKDLLRAGGAALLLILVTFVLRALSRGQPTISFGWTSVRLLWHLIPCGLLIAWCMSISRRILQKPVRRYLLAVGLLMLLWMTVRTVKWEFYTDQSRAARLCWYAYYIPMVMIPLIGVFVAHYVGRPERYEMPRELKLLYIPAGAMVLLVFTNDLHQQVFAFPHGMAGFDGAYTYRWGYFVIMAWFVLLGFYFVVTLIRKCRTPGRTWPLPLLVLAGAVAFWVLYCLKLLPGSDMVLINCMIVVALLESCIQSGLLRSNTGYEDMLASTTVAAQIVDRDYRVCYASGKAQALDEAQMRAAESAPVLLGENRLSSAPITGGRVLWMDDVSHINHLMDQLKETGSKLQEEGELLRAEIELRRKQAQIDEQNRLYDRINREVSAQLTALEGLLETPEDWRKNLTQVCVIGAYVKRRSNLVLLSETEQRLDVREMEYCLRESLDNLQLGGTACLLDCRCTGTAPADQIVAAYDGFEALLEPAAPELTGLMVRLTDEGGTLYLRLRMETGGPLPRTAVLSGWTGTLKRQAQEDAVVYDLTLPEGGGPE